MVGESGFFGVDYKIFENEMTLKFRNLFVYLICISYSEYAMSNLVVIKYRKSMKEGEPI